MGCDGFEVLLLQMGNNQTCDAKCFANSFLLLSRDKVMTMTIEWIQIAEKAGFSLIKW